MENHLHSYSQLASAATVPLQPTEQEKQAEKKLDELLSKVRCVSTSVLVLCTTVL